MQFTVERLCGAVWGNRALAQSQETDRPTDAAKTRAPHAPRVEWGDNVAVQYSAAQLVMMDHGPNWSFTMGNEVGSPMEIKTRDDDGPGSARGTGFGRSRGGRTDIYKSLGGCD